MARLVRVRPLEGLRVRSFIGMDTGSPAQPFEIKEKTFSI